jgi:hypothetical protein
MKLTTIPTTLKKLTANVRNRTSANLYATTFVCAALTIAVHISLTSSPYFAWYSFSTLSATLTTFARLVARLTWPIIQDWLLRSNNNGLLILWLRDEFTQEKFLRDIFTLSLSERAQLDLAECEKLQNETEKIRTMTINALLQRRH